MIILSPLSPEQNFFLIQILRNPDTKKTIMVLTNLRSLNSTVLMVDNYSNVSLFIQFFKSFKRKCKIRMDPNFKSGSAKKP
jgi:hypothetical protein